MAPLLSVLRRAARRPSAPRPVPATLRDPAHQREFAGPGYTVVDLLDAAAVDHLRAIAADLHPVRTRPWQSDFYFEDRDRKEVVMEAISAAVAPAIERLFVDHVSYLHAFAVNWPGPDGGLGLHQHSSVVDEERFRSAVIWCALTDVSAAEGTLYVVPGSHRALPGPKAERSPLWYERHEAELVEEHSVPIEISAGQAVVFDNALLHHSDPNVGDEVRVAAVVTAAPRAAELRYHSWDGDGMISYYRLHPSFFLDTAARDGQWAPPDELEWLGRVVGSTWEPTADELRDVLARR